MANKISPEAMVAAAWWASKLDTRVADNGGGGMMVAMMTIVRNQNAAPPPTDEQIAKFTDLLAVDIQKTLDDGCEAWLDVDYGPDRTLSGPAREAGLRPMFPLKTCMSVRAGKCSVKPGYGAEWVTIYPAPEATP